MLEVINVEQWMFTPPRRLLRCSTWRVARQATGLLLGPTGSGKSTLLGIIAGQLRPHRGVIRWRGSALADHCSQTLTRWAQRHVHRVDGDRIQHVATCPTVLRGLDSRRQRPTLVLVDELSRGLRVTDFEQQLLRLKAHWHQRVTLVIAEHVQHKARLHRHFPASTQFVLGCETGR